MISCPHLPKLGLAATRPLPPVPPRPPRARRLPPWLLGLLALAALPAGAQHLNTGKLDSLLTSLATHDKLMGSLALSRDGQVVYSRAFGPQQLRPAGSAPAATRYQVGSVTKMFTAVMIFQLIEEGKLTLATPLATFFPHLPNAQAITVDQLLSHRSGLYSFTSDSAWVSGHLSAQTPAQLLQLIGQGRPDFAPGTRAAYNNSGYVLLGYIIERLTKQSYAQALRRRVVARAGLVHTYDGGTEKPHPQAARGYHVGPTGWESTAAASLRIAGGAGALVSTPTDLTRFLEALFAGRLVSAASLRQMQTIRDGYGRGLFARPFETRQGYGHTGGIDDFVALTTYFPAEHLAVALCTNGQNYSPHEALAGALRIYFDQPYRLPTFAGSGGVPAPADLDRYAGTYASAQIPGLKITMTRRGTTLISEATGQGAVTLDSQGAGLFTFEQGNNSIRIEFDPVKPSFLLQQGGGSYLFSKL
ncbi:serine hydrolase domain-containing protein [Hymenobacter arizonensis]|uniref:CubicO group peptidase, beta-lactamase class C family n=1 Tax=Hymenobacter arizonensis TaxID=1227077 RepID=A0A1I6BE21_HYMAR|nr:serine hydrolase domain-containing protein [Hymenobacter arizonensis]SFQ79200.1 CubicO group peptidase, beta-lactamase class C family [Hymenobacter arizonensis]